MSLKLIPMPQKCAEALGEFIVCDATRILIADARPELSRAAEYLADRMRPATGFALPIATGAPGQPDSIGLALTPPDERLGAEGYRLRVAPDHVLLSAPTEAGLFYAIQTWAQLLPPQIESQWRVPVFDPIPPDCQLPPGWKAPAWRAPCVEIEDWPRFEWRGFMLDCSRHFRSVATLKWVIEKLARLKMNRFHLHLSDNHGWRVEVPKWPRLTQVGSCVEPEPRRHGFYTAADLREVVAYAARHHIMVIPEIDVPGHIFGAVAAYPDLCCTGKPIRNDLSHFHQLDILCAGNERVYEFLEDVFTTLASIFPAPYVHVGGDEAPKRRWRACPKCQEVIRREKLRDEEELQGYFVRRIADIVRRSGKRVIGWEEVINDQLPADTIVQWWRRSTGNAGALEAFRKGHQVIVSRGDFSYLNAWKWQLPDFYQAEYFPREPLFHAHFDEVGSVEPEEWKSILGAECCLWGETTPDELVASRMFPTILANAELAWRYPAPPQRDFGEFSKRVQALQSYFEGTAKLTWGS